MAGLFPLALFSSVVFTLVHSQDTRIWNVAVGPDWSSHEYIDTDGFLKGFGLDLIDYVCQEAKMDCRIVRDLYANCWATNPGVHPSVGLGLYRRWYDACTSWMPTIERIHSLKFTIPHIQPFTYYFYTLKNKNFDPLNLIGKKIGAIDGLAGDEKCLARQSDIKYKFTTSNTKYYALPTDALAALQSGEIDAIFSADSGWSTEEEWNIIDKVPKQMLCSLGGNGMMSRKDSAFTANWNVGLRKLKNTARLEGICNELNKKHGHKGATYECALN